MLLAVSLENINAKTKKLSSLYHSIYSHTKSQPTEVLYGDWVNCTISGELKAIFLSFRYTTQILNSKRQI